MLLSVFELDLLLVNGNNDVDKSYPREKKHKRRCGFEMINEMKKLC